MSTITLDMEKLRKVADSAAGDERWLRIDVDDGRYIRRALLRRVVESMPKKGNCRATITEHRSQKHVLFTYTSKRGARGRVLLMLHNVMEGGGIDRAVKLDAIAAA